MITLMELLQTYGYLGVFIGSIFEGEAVLFLGGLLAHRSIIDLNFTIVFAAAALGAFVGDNAWFWIGRYQRSFVHRKLPNAVRRAERMFVALQKRPRVFAAGMRFMYGFRSLIPLSLGLSHVPARTFVLWNFIGACAWSAVITGAGYYAAEFISTMFGRLQGRDVRLAVAVVVVAVVALIVYRILAHQARTITHAPEDSTLV